MKDYSEQLSDQFLIQKVKNNPNLLDLWDEVENTLPNCLLYLTTSEEYAQKTQK